MKEEYISYIVSNLTSISLEVLDYIAQLIEKSVEQGL